MAVLRAWFGGLWRVVAAPALLLGVYAFTLAITAPLGYAVHAALPAPIDHVAADPQSGVPPDLDWLDEVTANATGLTATLAPVVIGVAAPFASLSAVLDGQRPPTLGLVMSAAYFVLWAALWGGVIDRLAQNRGPGLRALVAASIRSWPLLLRVGGLGLVCYLILFLTVHALMFGPLYEWVTGAALERTAFLWRAGLTAVFVCVLASVGQVFDYARIHAVLDRPGSARDAVRFGAAFVRRHPVAVAILVIANGLLFGALLTAYGAVEFIPGGSVPRLSRVIAIGQAYIVGRLGLRLLFAATQINLYQRRH